VVRLATHVLLIALAAIVLTPLVWLIAATTKGKNDQFHYTFFAPKLTGQNYVDLYNKTDLFQHNLVNSIFLASTTVVVQLFFSSLAGFALAKCEFKGKRALTILCLPRS
jgi:ABC-type glycerol-3-phosphate transport system permease component